MGRKIVFDIETTGLLDHTTIDYSNLPYKLKDNFKIHVICAKVDNEMFEFVGDDVYKFKDIIQDGDILIGHNIIGFDLLFLKLYDKDFTYSINPNIHKRSSINDKHEVFCDVCCNKKVVVVDTLILSKLLNPDRIGGHSLKEWGKRLGNHKIAFGSSDGEEDVWEEFSEEMLIYCKQDVNLNAYLYDKLIEEAGGSSNFINTWLESYQLEASIADVVSIYQHYGFKFNKELAHWCVEDLNSKMEELEDRVHPQLPLRKLPKSQQPVFPKNPWKKPFDFSKMFTAKGDLTKKAKDYFDLIDWEDNDINFAISQMKIDGEDSIEKYVPKHKSLLSVSSINYCKKFNIDGEDFCFDFITKIENREAEQPILTEQMTLANQDDIKQYLVNIGWQPSNWNENDLLTDSKKKQKTQSKVVESIGRYVNETLESEYCDIRCKHLKCSRETLKFYLLSKMNGNKLTVLSTPIYTIDNDKNIDPNLIKLGEKVDFVKDVVLWLTYRHRKNSILSDNGTGWLTHPRLEIDGRLPTPADTLAAVTGRFRHSVIVNIPRNTSLYGEYMRGLFGVENEYQYQLGSDASALEARMLAHYTYDKEGGVEFTDELINGDIHTKTADAIGIERNEAKTLRYMISYGGQPAKIAKSMSWSTSKAKKVFNQFWDESKPLKILVEDIEKDWESRGKKHIKGVDGRLLNTRFKHALLNTLLQSAGVTTMKRQHVIFLRRCKDEGFLASPFDNSKEDLDSKILVNVFMHDELQLSVGKKLVRFKKFLDKDSCLRYIEETSGFVFGNPFEKNGEWYLSWSKIGEMCSEAFVDAGKYYNMNVPIVGDYVIGKSWKDCH